MRPSSGPPTWPLSTPRTYEPAAPPAPQVVGTRGASVVVVRSLLHRGALTRGDRPLLARGCLRTLPCQLLRGAARGQGQVSPRLPVAPLAASRTPRLRAVHSGGKDLPSLKVSSNLPVSGSSLSVRLNSAQGLFWRVCVWGAGLPSPAGMGTRGSRALQPASGSHRGRSPARF